jgi:hypothetical protein
MRDMRYLIMTALAVFVYFAMTSPPDARAAELICDEIACVKCDEIPSIVELCQQKVDYFEECGCAIEKSCLGQCVAKEVVCEPKGKSGKTPPACDTIKDHWVDNCQYNAEGDKCQPGPCC